MCECSNFSTCFSMLVCSSYYSFPNECEVLSLGDSEICLPNHKWCWTSFCAYLGICLFSVGKCLIQPFAQFQMVLLLLVSHCGFYINSACLTFVGHTLVQAASDSSWRKLCSTKLSLCFVHFCCLWFLLEEYLTKLLFSLRCFRLPTAEFKCLIQFELIFVFGEG